MIETVLCADSDNDFLAHCRRVMEAHGRQVICVDTGAELIAECKAHSPNLVICNSNLVDISGKVICETLRAHFGNETIPIIIICDVCDNEVIIECMVHGGSDFLVKPVVASELATRVNVALTRSRMQGDDDDERDDSSDMIAGKYEIVEELGLGGTSRVYLALNSSSVEEGTVAIKLFEIDAYGAAAESYNALFLREAYGLSKLNHDHIIRFLDFGKTGDSYFLVMEYFEGRSLHEIIRDDGPMPESKLVSVGFYLASTLQYLDEHNVVHRDIKPSNIMMSTDGVVKLTDFGLAKQQDDSSLTRQHEQFMGTPHFVAPEQIMAEPEIDIRCDVYSLGATLYFCGTGIYPFQGETLMDVLNTNMTESQKPASEVNPDLSYEFSEVLNKMLAKSPEDRYRPDELHEVLQQML